MIIEYGEIKMNKFKNAKKPKIFLANGSTKMK
jgi:hypothetical protein